MPIEDSGSFPFPEEMTTFDQVREYLVRLREAIVTSNTQLSSNVETRLAQINNPTISGTPANNQVATWTSATAIGPESTLVYDGSLLQLKGTGVAHGMTDYAETNTHGQFSSVAAADGGLHIKSLTEQVIAFILQAYYTVANTTQGETALGAIDLQVYKKSGTGRTYPDTGQNLVVIRTLDAATTSKARWLVDNDGNTWQFGYVIPIGGYKSSDGTAGATDTVTLATTTTMIFKNGLFTGKT